MSTFTIVDEFDATIELAEALYTIGVENPRTAANACSPYPYPSRTGITRILASEHPLLLAYDDEDGTLAGAIQFHEESGQIMQVVNRYYLAPDGSYTDKGDALVKALFAGIKERATTGRALSTDPNPNNRDVIIEFGGEFDS